MKITPAVIRHEFIGSEGKVTRSRHADYVGLAGEVIDETKKVFTLLHNGKPKKIIKESVVFNFRFQDGTTVEIDGKLLVGRPEDRLKKTIRRLW